MGLVRKVGQPAVQRSEQDTTKILEDVKDQLLEANIFQQELKRELDDERAKPPKIVVEKEIIEVPIEVEVEKEVIREVLVEDPGLIQAISSLELENKSIQQSLTALDSRTKIALQTAHLRILALETTLEQTSLTATRRKVKLDKIKETTQGRWPFMLKRTIRTLL